MDKKVRLGISSRREFLASGTTLGVTMFAGSSAFAGLADYTATHAGATGQTRTKDVLRFSLVGSTRVDGWLGDKIDRCIHARVMSQSIEALVQPFAEQSDKDDGWRGEFWGKWFTSAVLAYRYEPTAAHRAVLDNAVAALLKTHDENGRIDSYDAGHRGGAWDVWTRKYVLLGLLDYYDATRDEQSLRAARAVGDTLLADFGPGKASLPEAGLSVLGGLSPSSVPQPVCLLYERTGERHYLDFAEYIVAQWETPNRNAPHGMHLVEDALAGKAPTEMVVPKAYEMMSCFEGLCELYRITGRPQYKEAVVRFGETLRHSERMVNGGASNQELWCRGAVTLHVRKSAPLAAATTPADATIAPRLSAIEDRQGSQIGVRS